MKNLKILLIGTLPPPIGGVTIHVERLFQKLNRQGHFVKVIQPRSILNLLYLFYYCVLSVNNKKFDIAHLHFELKISRFFIIFITSLCCKKLIYTFHNERFKISPFPNIKRYIINSFDKIICVSKNTRLKIKPFFKNKKIDIIPAYITTKDTTQDKYVLKIINEYNKYKYIFIANAYKLYLDENNIDVYGIDLLIELSKRLKNQNVDFCLFVLNPQIGDKNYYKKICSSINKYRLNKNFKFIHKKITNCLPLWKNASIFLRPTNTDGDSISIRESLSVQTPVIASDVSKRPEGTILFKSRDINDLFKKVIDHLDYKPFNKYNLKDYGNDVIKLYYDLTNINSW